jgi:hypothetical protein
MPDGGLNQDAASAIFARNSAWVKPGQHTYNTPLAPKQERAFRDWLGANSVPFDPAAQVSDYDMRGFWKGLQAGDPRAASAVDPNDNRIHYPDYWKTPYHETFSNESQWATPDAPHWKDDQLVTKNGDVLFDDKARPGYAGGGAPSGDGLSDADLMAQYSKPPAAPAIGLSDDDLLRIAGGKGLSDDDLMSMPTSEPRGALPVFGSSAAQAAVTGVGEAAKGVMAMQQVRPMLAPYWDLYQRFPSMSPDEQKAAERQVDLDSATGKIPAGIGIYLSGKLEEAKAGQQVGTFEEFAGLPPQETGLYKAGEDIQKYGEQTFPVTPAERAAHPRAAGAGQVVGGAGPAAATAILSSLAGVPEIGLPIAAGQMGLMSAAQQGEQARAHGASEDEAARAAQEGFVAGTALGALPLGAIMKPIERSAPGLVPWATAKLKQAAVSGAGSLAHEWGHALDHYFGELDRTDAYKGAARGASGWYGQRDYSGKRPLANLRPEMAEAFDKVMSALFKRQKTRAEAVREAELSLENLQGAIGQLEKRVAMVRDRVENAPSPREKKEAERSLKESQEWLDSQKTALKRSQQRLADLRGDADVKLPDVESSYYRNARKLSGKAGSGGYWARPTEMFARAFEAHVFDKLAERGDKSQYLVQGVEGERYAKPEYKGNPYPVGMERDAINKAFDHLVSTLETRPGKDGMPAMYQALTPRAPTFYSALERGVESGPEKAPAVIWKGYIRNLASKGVKQEEVDWSGVNDWLDQQHGAVSKADLLRHIRDNNVQIKEVMKGGGPPHQFGTPEEQAAANDRLERARQAVLSTVPGTPESSAARDEHRAAESAMRDIVPGWGRAQGSEENATKYGSYTLPGGESYRELLLTLPARDATRALDSYLRNNPTLLREIRTEDDLALAAKHNQQFRENLRGVTPEEALNTVRNINSGRRPAQPDFRSNHWDEPNVLAHVRMNDRTDVDGKKALLLEELQSDWHQKGRRYGYQTDAEQRFQKLKGEVEARHGQSLVDMRAMRDKSPDIVSDLSKIDEAYRLAQEEKHGSSKPPPAPFETSWHELAMKRMLRYAAENGYDRVAWTTGDQQAARYDLSKRVRSVAWNEKTGEIQALGLDGKVVDLGTATKDKLPDYIGKDAAERIAAADENVHGFRTISGDDLKAGGAGMRSFYDKILPSFVNKYAKKWGAKVGETGLASSEEVPAGVDVPFEVFNTRTGEVVARYQDENVAAAEANRRGGEYDYDFQKQKPIATAVHSVDITPEMRQGVMGGQPMFKRESAASEPAGERVQIVPGLTGTIKPTEAYTKGEREIAAKVDAIAEKMIPGARVQGYESMRAQRPGEEPQGVGGSFSRHITRDGLARVVSWSLESPDAVGTVRHEAIHYVRDLVSPEEWGTLAKAAEKEGWMERYGIAERYPDSLGRDKLLEEAVADHFSTWRRDRFNLPEPLKAIFNKIDLFLRRVAAAARSIMGKDATSDDIFRRSSPARLDGARSRRSPASPKRGRKRRSNAHLPR